MAKARPIKGLNPHATTSENAHVIARARLEDMYEWNRYVDNPFNIRELHDLRIAAKRLRYTLEVFEDVLPETSQLIIEELTQIQDELGALHDSDVLIALLRLCLGSQNSGTAYENALSKTKNQNGKQKTLVQPELVATLLDPAHPPSAEERYGLEQLLVQQEQNREKQYTAFRQHWYQLQAQNFRHQILNMLDDTHP